MIDHQTVERATAPRQTIRSMFSDVAPEDVESEIAYQRQRRMRITGTQRMRDKRGGVKVRVFYEPQQEVETR